MVEAKLEIEPSLVPPTVRRCFVLTEVEVPMNMLKAGDVFRLTGDPQDNEDQLYIAESDAQNLPPPEYCFVKCQPVGIGMQIRWRNTIGMPQPASMEKM